ncbi:GNAT family N-acetyltransferase [Sphingomonas abietis]|uniref:GNAT family N-acetyltransferase n=1 Tax=Sphingomonas abietis TaxID=3012344 RepID=A0ABY7NU63_9SPHN|nr:GNAT family N-acetyltransferase [Sphingomonas abietis]WBO24112.1 GNAT family N-acetyltransferase [Sphingomonas abietis]
MPVSVEWYDDLDAVAADAGDTLDRAHQPWLYGRLDWFRLTREHVLPDAKLAILRIRSGEATAWLFLIESAPRRAAPLASWYTLRFAPVLHGDAAAALLPDLYRAAARRFDVLELRPLDAPTMPEGWRSFARRTSSNWTLETNGRNFATYWAERPARTRNTVLRRMKSHPVSIEIHRDFDPAAWADYEAVYAESWKPQEGSPAFLRALAAQEAAAGTLRLGIARGTGGRAVAAQFWLIERGIATIHKLAHRESAKSGSPGSLLSHAMFRAAIDGDQVARIDFGLGDEPYKVEWVDTPHPVWRVDAYRPASWRGAIGVAREVAGRLARPVRRG